MSQPQVLDNAFYKLLREERVTEFNQLKAAGKMPVDALRGGDLRGLDLRQLDAADLDLRDVYLRGADLRGVDFSRSRLAGASICQAHISGCYFPRDIDAYELRLSFDLGTRLRSSAAAS